jgi:hypothetical protein
VGDGFRGVVDCGWEGGEASGVCHFTEKSGKGLDGMVVGEKGGVRGGMECVYGRYSVYMET